MKLRGIDFGCIFAASGALNFFGQGWVFHKIYKRLFPKKFDFSDYTIVAKTTTFHPRLGNMPLDKNLQPKELRPKCIKLYPFIGAAINAVGLSGPGLIELLNRGGWNDFAKPFFISYMAVENRKRERLNNLTRLVFLLEKFSKFKEKIGLEINESCPNTAHDPKEIAKEAVNHLKIIRNLGVPIIVKLSPLVRIDVIKRICDSDIADALTIGNTISWNDFPERLRTKYFGTAISPLSKFGGGGISGNPIRPFALAKIREVRKSGITIPIIGGGGIMDPRHVDEFEAAGADAVTIGTAAMLRPWNVKKIAERAKEIF